jgi:hypothetical protein
MLALSFHSPLVGTFLGGLLAVALFLALGAAFYRMAMRKVDETNGINPKRKDSQSHE